jgi:hypothetical protein
MKFLYASIYTALTSDPEIIAAAAASPPFTFTKRPILMIKLINDNCVDVMPGLKSRFDLVITSPPYNANKEYETSLSIEDYMISRTT